MRLLPVLVLVLGCGGGGADPDPLISGSLTATFDGTDFTPTNGFAVVYMDSSFLVLGDGNVHCGSESSNSPPTGHGAFFQLDSFDVGTHSSLLTSMYGDNGGYHSEGTNTGTVTIAASSAMSIAGMVDFSYTSDSYGPMQISGAFESIVCQ
jgi:hypothetical protein